MYDKKHLGLVIEAELLEKIRYIAASEARSINGQLLHLMRQCVADFEAKNGPIHIEDTEPMRRT